MQYGWLDRKFNTEVSESLKGQFESYITSRSNTASRVPFKFLDWKKLQKIFEYLKIFKAHRIQFQAVLLLLLEEEVVVQ